MQRHIEQHLVISPIEEGGINRHHRMTASHRKSGGAGHCMLFGNTDVKEPIWVSRSEGRESGWAGHGCSDGNHLWPASRLGDQCISKDPGPTGTTRSGWLSRCWINHTDTVEPITFIGLRWCVAVALLCQAMHNHRTGESGGLPQTPFQLLNVVTVDRTNVFQAEILEHSLRREHVLDALFHTVQRVEHGFADHWGAGECTSPPAQHSFVAASGAQRRQMIGEPANGRSVRSRIVVDHDDHWPISGGNVVEGFPGHTAGQGPIADYRDNFAISRLIIQLVRLGESVSVGQGGRGVGVFNEIVLALRSGRVAG